MDEVRAPTQAGIRIRGRTYLIHLIHIHPQSQSQCLWQDSQRPQWESLHFRTERRVQDWPRGILLVIFPCFLRFWLRFWIFLDRARSAETSVSVSIRMESGVFCIHYQRSIFIITFINKEHGARKIRTEGTGRQIYFLQYGFCASQR